LLGDDIARAARRAYLLSDRGSLLPNQGHQLVIVLTDRDMYLPGTASFAFAVDERDVAVVSLARMDPAFPLINTESYVPRRASCTAALMERAYKKITRQIVHRTCGPFWRIYGLSALDGLEESDKLQ
jgi:hypothetical protein